MMALNSFWFLGANLQFGIVLICCSVTQSLRCGRRFRPRPRATARPFKAARFVSGSGWCCSTLVWLMARPSRAGMGWDGGIHRANCFCIVINIGCMFFGSHWKGATVQQKKKKVLPLHICMGKRKGRRQNGVAAERGQSCRGRKSATQLHKFVYLWLFRQPTRESQAEGPASRAPINTAISLQLQEMGRLSLSLSLLGWKSQP